MEYNTQNSSGMMNGMPPTIQPQPEKKVGPIVAALIIVLILIIAALYFFGLKLNKSTTSSQPSTQTTATEQASDKNVASVSSLSDIKAMESDLDAQLQDVDYSF